MVHADGEVAASDQARADAVTEAQRWLSERGLAAPDPMPVSDAPRSGPARRETAAGVGLLRESGREPASGGGADGLDQGGAGSQGGSGSWGRVRSRTRAGSDPGLTRASRSDAGDTDPEEVARGVVLRKLTGQARSRHELDQALRSQQIPEAVANGVLDRMEESGLVNDAVFARDWVESRQQRRHLSRRALRHELQTKGVDADLIADALSTVDGEDEYEAARALAERKVGRLAGLPREVRYRRLAGVLARRGFSGGVIGRVIAEVLTDGSP